MTKQIPITNNQNRKMTACSFVIRALSFLLHLTFDIRHFPESESSILRTTQRFVGRMVFLCCLLGLIGCGKQQQLEGTQSMSTANEVAVIKTSEGEMTVEFWDDAAPNTIENFKKLARSGFYNGTIFHRIVKGFMIQGGDPLSKDPSNENVFGTGDPGYKIKAEFNDHSHERGVLSMARSSDPDSAGSQFFICLAPVTRLDHQYTTFGKLIKGEDVLEKIGNTPVTVSHGEMSKPTTRVVIEKVDIVPAESAK
jgi:peptidyl-prolyl cis-trans isomerase B (cyclophilin B)